MALDLHKLSHLVAVAEEGSFTRAAKRLHLTQQALSTSIRTLEREVGVELLDRSGAALVVLPAGQALVQDARVLHGAAESALRRARRIGRDETETLRIGHTPAVTGDEVSVLLRRLAEHDPEPATEVNQRYPGELAEQLQAGELDLGLCRAMPAERGLCRGVLAQQRLRVAVAAEHALAAREKVALEELAGETITVWGTPGKSGYTELLIHRCRQAGFEPRVRRNPVQGTPPVTAVLGSEHVALVTAAPGAAAGGQVRVVALDPPVFVPLHALWHEHTTSEARDALLAAFGAG